MVPHGDRVDGAKSGRVEDVIALGFAHDDVMREFVLHDDLDDVGAVCAAPREHIFERAQLHDPASIRYARAVRLIGFAVVAALAAACTRDPASAECPDISPGDLVVTEIQGPQMDATQPAWIELYNASSSPIDLEGTRIRFRRKDGSSEVPVIVRRSVTVAGGGYIVLGLVDDAMRPDYISYGFLNDFHVPFLAAAAIDVQACGTLIDRAVYDALPKTGSHSLGTSPPNKDDNDVPASWCDKPTATPGQANPTCP